MSQQKAISATGDDQKVGFRAMVMKQAIEYNLAGIAKNDPNMIVRFTLQGDGKRIDKVSSPHGAEIMDDLKRRDELPEWDDPKPMIRRHLRN
jgi:acylphosphatase